MARNRLRLVAQSSHRAASAATSVRDSVHRARPIEGPQAASPRRSTKKPEDDAGARSVLMPMLVAS
jgi:hypothetical protein